MPKFYFNTEGQVDDEGTELESLAIAKCQAIKMAGEIICDEAESFWEKAEWTLTVSNEAGLTLFQLSIVGTESPAVRLMASARATSASPSY